MARKITNTKDIPLFLAVWLLHDDYDYQKRENYISATSLLKPVRHLILPKRIAQEEEQDFEIDLDDLVAKALGQSLHASVEKAWENPEHRKAALEALGYAPSIADRVALNPDPATLSEHDNVIPIYMEKRQFREIEVMGQTYTVGGKFDAITEGMLNDTKSTSAWAWALGSRDEEHIDQLSIYRWIDAAQEYPLVTQDMGQINYLFTDWQRAMARTREGYPDSRIKRKVLPLKSLDETEALVRAKIAEVIQYQDAPEPKIPRCTDEELWRSDPEYKYYSDPTKTLKDRSTKNFKTLAEAEAHRAKVGKGIVLTKLSEPKRCEYCDASPICSQFRELFPQ